MHDHAHVRNYFVNPMAKIHMANLYAHHLDLWGTFWDYLRGDLKVFITVQNLAAIAAVVLITRKLEYYVRLA